MTDTQVADPLLGTLVDGRYRVRDRIARGGMATVYTAVDERLDRTVALKIVHPTQAGEPEFVDRFMDEAKAIARLTHPNVVAAYDRGTHDGLPYLVMEYVRGRTLREILGSRRRLTPVEALAITEQMLAAIAAAHRAGLVHRDVKPENVLVAAAPSGGTTNLVDSVVKVTDFGLAQAVQASTTPAAARPGTAPDDLDEPSDPDSSDSGGTDPDGGAEPAEGPLLATVAYVAPELVADGRADPRSDVYSTGIVLFEMLTGRVPFDGGDPAEIAWRHVDEDVPRPSTLVAGVPPGVDALVVRATRRDPRARPTDAGALLTEVQASREEVTTGPVRPRRTTDQTVVLSAVPTTERPAWARLPSPKARSATIAGPPGRGFGDGSPGGPLVAGPPPPPRRRGGRSAASAAYRRRAVAAAGVALLVLALAATGWWFGIGRWEPAPDLVGMAEAEAVARAEERGLAAELAEPEYDDQVPAGHVLSQDPTRRIVKGGTVTLTLSLGPEVHPVPDVVGASFEVAERQLEALGLVVVEGEGDHSDTVPAGRVLSVDPPVGQEVTPGTEVTVVVSQGRAPIDVPSVIGQPADTARGQLEGLGLAVTIEQVDSTEPADRVIGQDPAAGSGASPGDTVTLQVSNGPPTTPVPEVTGQPCDRAAQTLQQAGFTVQVAGGRGAVLLQSPSAGTGLPPGEQVTIWCGP
ncbi:MAG: PASTA domain-containing protein [Micromonosporaceae bacterium]|nr:PASTA domain-containing protein [Micromonosporaceae bacterium]